MRVCVCAARSVYIQSVSNAMRKRVVSSSIYLTVVNDESDVFKRLRNVSRTYDRATVRTSPRLVRRR